MPCMVPLDGGDAAADYSNEPADDASPEVLFDRNWARAMMDITMKRIHAEYLDAGEIERFKVLQVALEDAQAVPYEELAAKLNMTPNGVKSAVRRMRLRFRGIFRETVAWTLENPAEVDQEIAYLIDAMR